VGCVATRLHTSPSLGGTGLTHSGLRQDQMAHLDAYAATDYRDAASEASSPTPDCTPRTTAGPGTHGPWAGRGTRHRNGQQSNGSPAGPYWRRRRAATREAAARRRVSQVTPDTTGVTGRRRERTSGAAWSRGGHVGGHVSCHVGGHVRSHGEVRTNVFRPGNCGPSRDAGKSAAERVLNVMEQQMLLSLRFVHESRWLIFHVSALKRERDHR
jgi:hypothetical protein